MVELTPEVLIGKAENLINCTTGFIQEYKVHDSPATAVNRATKSIHQVHHALAEMIDELKTMVMLRSEVEAFYDRLEDSSIYRSPRQGEQDGPEV